VPGDARLAGAFGAGLFLAISGGFVFGFDGGLLASGVGAGGGAGETCAKAPVGNIKMPAGNIKAAAGNIRQLARIDGERSIFILPASSLFCLSFSG
jgi:hypothetical protein